MHQMKYCMLQQKKMVAGSLETCQDCTECNARQKGIAKTTETQSTVPCEGFFMDSTYINTEALVVANTGLYCGYAIGFTSSILLTALEGTCKNEICVNNGTLKC